MNDLIRRGAALDTVANMRLRCDTNDIDDFCALLLECFAVLPTAEPEITLLQATKTVLEFMKLCGGTTAYLITPDGERLSCDWGYVEDGLCELVRYAERRTDG